MSKEKKLYYLRLNISTEAQRIRVLLEHILHKSESPLEISVLAGMAFEKSCKIQKMSEQIGKILNH